MYLPLSRELIPDLNQELVAAVQLVGRLHDDQTLTAGRAALNAAAGVGQEYRERKMGAVGLFAPVGGLGQAAEFPEVGIFFGVLLVGAALILATACANVAGCSSHTALCGGARWPFGSPSAPAACGSAARLAEGL